MPLRLAAKEREALPPLAWFAEVDTLSQSIEVHHGALVETRGDWLVEGVWSEDFEAGGFPISEHFFGSGVHLTDDGVVFVPSSALVDRLL
jgi:hypothetical protein